MNDQSPSTTLGVIGLGYVGLPLAVEAGQAGINVIGFDVNPTVTDLVNSGDSHIQDVPAEHVAALRDAGLLEATTDMARLSECDVVSICVPTPLSKTRDPDVSYILAASESVAAGLRRGQLVVLESTTYPGTTREVMLPALEATGLRVGRDFNLCFSPERVDPGNATWHTKNTPKVIGGITAECTASGVAFYERFIDTVVPVSSSEAAEMTKILENTFRAVNIGLVNETALIAERLGVDVWEVIDAAATKPFGFMKFTPGPGLGGHCIPVDPHYLSWKMRTLNYKTRFIELASEINSEMPYFVVDKVREALNRQRKAVNGASVLLLGVAYKRDIDDVRESPALDVLKLLAEDGASVSYHDPFVPQLYEEGVDLESVELTDDALSDADMVVILTDHSGFDYDRVVNKAVVLVDARHVAPRPDGTGRGWIVKG
ncbi:MAG: nucleotide sugar dehydrogenase [Gemmatimonadota bacterium]|nr:nucleotide sugar dehydrogenase [Gemmatimonadota bacterium]MDE3005445.1 nucleotide sugar dehydrogenase [Gemmatimonadota bacterium]MDE3013651.1 nucleotide sugar dehydrogenase [Gemmatimonadota bacterium]